MKGQMQTSHKKRQAVQQLLAQPLVSGVPTPVQPVRAPQRRTAQGLEARTLEA